ncbi:hypothetical protein O3M35_006496 [Rhynocoris fuscipes]|uniref:Uncharacterized protein n=1 Tax=Rhynocoris fuscipes TaxID=488301 RepID=A0AAW1DKZ8_9HEMI
MEESDSDLEEKRPFKSSGAEVEVPRSLYRTDFVRPHTDFIDKPPITTIYTRPPRKIHRGEEPCPSFKHLGTLGETDSSRYATGYMKHLSEYQRSYHKQPTHDNHIPKLHENLEKLYSDFKDCAQMPKPQLVKPPYASLNIDSLPLQTKKKVLEKYYQSDKTYYMEDNLSFKTVDRLPTITREDLLHESNLKLKTPSDNLNTTDEIEAIAPLFYKYNSDLKQIPGLQAEILRLMRRSKDEQKKQKAEKIEEEINKKIERNMQLKKESKLRFPYRQYYGFRGYYPNVCSHDEEDTSSKYPLYNTTYNVMQEQLRRRMQLEKSDTDVLKYRVECFDSKKMPVCFEKDKYKG